MISFVQMKTLPCRWPDGEGGCLPSENFVAIGGEGEGENGGATGVGTEGQRHVRLLLPVYVTHMD